MATRLNRKSAIFREDSADDLAAKVRAADEAIAHARAEQQAASDRLAREVGHHYMTIFQPALQKAPPQIPNVHRSTSRLQGAIA
jgi:hypothetical protein